MVCRRISWLNVNVSNRVKSCSRIRYDAPRAEAPRTFSEVEAASSLTDIRGGDGEGGGGGRRCRDEDIAWLIHGELCMEVNTQFRFHH